MVRLGGGDAVARVAADGKARHRKVRAADDYRIFAQLAAIKASVEHRSIFRTRSGNFAHQRHAQSIHRQRLFVDAGSDLDEPGIDAGWHLIKRLLDRLAAVNDDVWKRRVISTAHR